MRSLRTAFFILATALLSGCGVYNSEFSCPQTFNGRCISLQGAYDLAITDNDGNEMGTEEPSQQRNQKAVSPSHEQVAHATYKESLFKRFDGLLKEPNTPMVAPPQVIRVLLLPYKGESNELFMLRYVYFFADEPRWVLGDSLVDIEEE